MYVFIYNNAAIGYGQVSNTKLKALSSSNGSRACTLKAGLAKHN